LAVNGADHPTTSTVYVSLTGFNTVITWSGGRCNRSRGVYYREQF